MKSLVNNFVTKINTMRKMLEEQYDAMIAVKIGLVKWEFRYTFEKDNISLNVFYAPTVLRANGLIGACVAEYDGKILVYTDDQFEKLTKDEQEAILLHEMHHIIHRDKISNLSIIKRALGFKSAIKIEILADEYAVKNSSKEVFISGLKKIVENAPKSTLKEVNKRIKHLEEIDY